MSPSSRYKSSPTKRPRRGKADIDAIKGTIYRVVEQDRPMTVRQVFYRLVSLGVIAKTEGEYKNTVCRLLVDMRRAGELPYGWIADHTRWMRKSRSFDSPEDALELTISTYRRALWSSQDVRVQVWLEKDALAGVVFSVTDAWDVPLMVTRGYASLSFLDDAAERIKNAGKPSVLYYLGDRDPSGIDIPRKVEEGIRRLAPKAEMQFEIIAVTPEQIIEWELPTRPTKTTDSRSKSFQGESVEADAIEPDRLRALVEASIMSNIDQVALERVELEEKAERATLQQLVDNGFWRDGGRQA